MRQKIGEDDIKSIEREYGISVISQETPNTGDMNQVVFLDTNKGQRVLKKYRNDWDKRGIAFTVSVSEHARAKSMPCPEVYRNKSNQLITGISGSNYTLMEKLDGRPVQVDSYSDLELSLKGLSQLNQALRRFSPDIVFPLERFRKNMILQWQELEKVLPTKARNDIDEYVLSTKDYIKKAIKTYFYDSSFKFPLQIIHGDYNLNSVLVKNNDVSAIIDFDFAREDSFAGDVLHTLDLYCIDKESKFKKSYDRVEWDKLSRLAEAYLESDPEIKKFAQDAPFSLARFALNTVMMVWAGGYSPNAALQQKDYFDRRYGFFVNRFRVCDELKDELSAALRVEKI